MLLDGRESEKVARDLVRSLPFHYTAKSICHLREAIKSGSTCSFAAHVCTLHVEGEVERLFVQVARSQVFFGSERHLKIGY